MFMLTILISFCFFNIMIDQQNDNGTSALLKMQTIIWISTFTLT